ncbi:MAG: hydroxylamine reductase [Candidatus Delongbacteria bacterium]|nr:hydroxylamine reductase [Candidatus Delongbacteria bacterium]MBN2836531.1 hydroxylamine reductase [Candidatus Delongbacteria bacterium]
MGMFCYQCQEAMKGTGCAYAKGACGKDTVVANLQDVLIFATKTLAYVVEVSKIKRSDLNRFIAENLFTTITNANFDENFFVNRIYETATKRDEIARELQNLPKNVTISLSNRQDIDNAVTVASVLAEENEDIRSLKELLIYGLKGMAAYYEHALNLGYENQDIADFTVKALSATMKNLELNDYLGLVLECGKFGVDVMALLDKANTETYGNPEVSKVNIGVRNNPGILISGHDLKDLEELLVQTEGTGIDVYTHCEMLPAHYYPKFKKYSHFVGNYGNAWWKQDKEFESFNGPVLLTSNCLVPPKESYKNRIFTTGTVGFDGCTHIEQRNEGNMKDFSPLIEMAKTCQSPVELEKGEIIGGFAHAQITALADKVVEAVKSGAVKKFVVMAGCDGRSKERDYYTDFANELPKDSVILTAGCAKFKYNKLNLGDIGGIPRVLDAGQCNDSYSLAVTALKLKEAFGLENINDLPIAYNIAWYEQKAVIVLLALLHLGVKNITLGPTLPAFLSQNVVKVLVDNFGIGGITNVKDDMKRMVG